MRTAGTPEHLTSNPCRDLTAQWQQHKVAAASAAALSRTFTTDKDNLRHVEQFKYLECIMSMDDNTVPAMRRNLKRAQKTWGSLSKVLKKEEVSPKVAGMFYQGAVASQLLYNSKTWMIPPPPSGLRALES